MKSDVVLDQADRLPRQVAEQLRRSLKSGRWPSGAALPSTRQLAIKFGVSKKTIGEAYEQLERDGLILRQNRRRAVVKSSARVGNQIAVLMTPGAQRLSNTKPNWFGQVLWAADEVLMQAGFRPIRIPVPDGIVDARSAAEHLRTLVQSQTAGVILIGGQPESERLAPLLDDAQVPWVSLRPITPLTPHNYVTVDFFEACRAMGELFYRSGRRRLLYMGMADTREQMQMLAGFEYGIMCAGGRHADILHVPTQGLDEPEGFALMSQWLVSQPAPDAVLAAGDFLALGVMRACRQASLRVPEQVAVAGASGYPTSAYTDPPLTVIHHPTQQLGRQLANMLLTCLAQRRQHVMGVHLGTHLVIRESFPAAADAVAHAQGISPDIRVVLGSAAPGSLD